MVASKGHRSVPESRDTRVRRREDGDGGVSVQGQGAPERVV